MRSRTVLRSVLMFVVTSLFIPASVFAAYPGPGTPGTGPVFPNWTDPTTLCAKNNGDTITLTVGNGVSVSNLVFTVRKGGTGGDVMWGTAGQDIMCGMQGDDVLNGLGGFDIIVGGVGDDKIYGGCGLDFLWGGIGNDTIFGEASTNTPSLCGATDPGGRGHEDLIYGGPGKDELHGEYSKDSIYGGDYFTDTEVDTVWCDTMGAFLYTSNEIKKDATCLSG